MEEALLEELKRLRPSRLSYQEWLQVGMALKEEGFPEETWETWSRDDPRYLPGECERKWESFRGAEHPVTGAYIRELAAASGCEEPEKWQPKQELVRYLRALFQPSDLVGYVTESREKKRGSGKWQPGRGRADRTAGELIELLESCGDDIRSVIGDYNPRAGAWIGINPLDGGGLRSENVADFRYALIESDDMELSQQEKLIKKLQLPVAALVYSGGKSLHAVVRIDAPDREEYRRRVEFLYRFCEENGLRADGQNKNPSRLSRMPGVMRNGKKQFLLGTGLGKSSWEQWRQSVEERSDGLPGFESLEGAWEHIPEPAPCLIEGVLRKSHKLLLAGPPKAGKSFLLIELCVAIAEGRSWLGWPCARGRVLYVNLELDRVSCLRRFLDVYRGLGISPEGSGNIDLWNLRGRSVPMDRLTPLLIRRARGREYAAVVIDPIYKLITGDENSAAQMAYFCGQFDRICAELGCSVIYSHHHSKGHQGGKKSMDRASGSGVFSRDPDALLDLIELPLSGVHGLEEKTRKGVSAWRMEGVFREFPGKGPVNFWFEYPIHRLDESGELSGLRPERDGDAWLRGTKQAAEEKIKMRLEQLERCFRQLESRGPVSVEQLALFMGVTGRSVRNYIQRHGGFAAKNGIVERTGRRADGRDGNV